MSLLMEFGSMAKSTPSSTPSAKASLVNHRAARATERVLSVQNCTTLALERLQMGGYSDARVLLREAQHEVRMALAELPRGA